MNGVGENSKEYERPADRLNEALRLAERLRKDAQTTGPGMGEESGGEADSVGEHEDSSEDAAPGPDGGHGPWPASILTFGIPSMKYQLAPKEERTCRRSRTNSHG